MDGDIDEARSVLAVAQDFVPARRRLAPFFEDPCRAGDVQAELREDGDVTRPRTHMPIPTYAMFPLLRPPSFPSNSLGNLFQFPAVSLLRQTCKLLGILYSSLLSLSIEI